MNLWSDLDNNEYPPPTTRRRSQRLTEQLVLSTLRDWLLNEYVTRYCHALAATRIFRRCYWIDGLGIADKDPAEAEQALSVLSPSHILAQKHKPITLYGFTLEAGSSRRRETKAAQNGTATAPKQIDLPRESGIVRASWLEVALQLFAKLDQSPTVFVLNPLGPTMFTADDLAQLYQRKVPTELCFYVSHKQIEVQLRLAQRSPTHAPALTELLHTDRWKTLSTKEQDIEHSIEAFIEFFVTTMQKHFQLPVQRIVLPIQMRTTLVENIPYTLLFATRRQDSLLSMNDALCCYKRRVYEQSYRGVLAEEWFTQQHHERIAEYLAQLYQRVLQQGRAQHTRRWPDLQQQIVYENFGRCMQQEYDQVILRLLANKEVYCEWRRSSPTQEEEQRIPGNDDILLWK
ncbi:MAG: hypothetical protein JO183_05770 [Ktedonobacteraceae bacterium]|nr:hypothetical protein [Ktedonobacteraceae bacterium]